MRNILSNPGEKEIEELTPSALGQSEKENNNKYFECEKKIHIPHHCLFSGLAAT